MGKRKLRVGFTFDLFHEHTLSPLDPPDRYNEFDTKISASDLCEALSRGGYEVVKIGNLEKLLRELPTLKERVDIVFNTAEGLSGRNREAEIPLLLEHYGISFVGSDACTMSVTLDKVVTKKMLIAEGIPTPRYVISSGGVSQDDVNHLNFPLIVKPRWEGSSKGITGNAVVASLPELNEQIRSVNKSYRQPALVEEFITGREFTVGFIGNGKDTRQLPLLEVVFGGEAVGDRAYLSDYVYTADASYIEPQLSKGLAEKILVAARQTYETVECLDFGRVDLRLDERGNVYVLEINPLPALSKEDAFAQAAELMGITYDKIICQILESGMKRYGIGSSQCIL